MGVAFGFAFFYLFLNIYHYREIRREAYIDFEQDASVLEFDSILERVQANVESLPTSDVYQGSLEYNDAALWQDNFRTCIKIFKNSTFQEIRTKQSLDILDIYKFRESFEQEVLNECIVKQLYNLVAQNPLNNSYLQQNKELLQAYMDDLLQDTSYLKKDLTANGNYYFTTDASNLIIKNDVKDGFYEVMSAYNRAARFLELMSNWYRDTVGGTL